MARVGLADFDDGLVVRLARRKACTDHRPRMAAQKKTAKLSKSSSRPTRRPTKRAAKSAPYLDQTKRDPAIDEYLANVNPKSRAVLQELRRTIHAFVPEVVECISYRIPAFRYEGRIVGGFTATSTGCSYYPFSGTTLATLAADIEGYSHTKSALHFGADKPLPPALVKKLLKARMPSRGSSHRARGRLPPVVGTQW